MKMKLAIFNLKWGFMAYDESMGDYTDCVRITEFVEVDFPDLPKEIVTVNQVSAIDRKIEDIKAKAMEEVSKLQIEKSELLALTHEVEE